MVGVFKDKPGLTILDLGVLILILKTVMKLNGWHILYQWHDSSDVGVPSMCCNYH